MQVVFLLAMHVLTFDTGCMESLVHYKRLLLRKHAASLRSEEQEGLVKDCVSLLQELEALDPARRQRYKELCKW